MKKLLGILLGALMVFGCAEAAADPRGVRTNNPGNVVKSPIQWQGEVECADTLNECFSSPYYGIRAMVKVLHTYYHKHKLTTIRQIMARFSEFKGAANGVSRLSGIGMDVPLNFDSIEHWEALTKAIITQENGVNPYPDSLIRQVLYDTYGIGNNGSIRAGERGDQVVEGQAGQRGGETPPNNGSTNQGAERAFGDSGEHERGIHMDEAPDRVIVCVCRSGNAQDDSRVEPEHSGDNWLDRIERWVLALYRGEQHTDMACGKGAGNHSP